jgi:type IV pilus assembly protein PilB
MSSRIGELLIQQGIINQTQWAKASEQASQNGEIINYSLVKLGIIEESKLIELISQQYGLPVVKVGDQKIAKELIQLIPQHLSTKHHLLPIDLKDSTLTIAMVDPSNIVALNDVRFITGLDIKVVIAGASELKNLIEKSYEEEVSYEGIMADFEENVELIDQEEDLDINALAKASEDAPVAIKKGTSDIHFEPYEKTFRVRFRIDGVLYEIMKPPMKLRNAIISRIKIMSSLDIAERRLPQDGRIKLKLGNKKEMDFRVSVLPGLFGEKIVLRLLDKSNLQADMTKLGFEEKQLKDFMAAIDKPYGMVLVTGPTGSGKTTTLYSALAELNKNTVNIATAEDPVEFNLFGVNQCQMHEDIGLNFAAALRSFLRQDPDVIMVGEIRDYETAEIAIKASLTGHLVLSTLHTNDAPATINRLLNMGVEPFLVASSINIIVAQRLARRICQACKEEMPVSPDILINVGIPAAEAKHTVVHHGKGCQKCANTGYKGRVALYERLSMNEAIRDLVLNGASSAEIKREAIKGGMWSLRMSGLHFLKEGTTTIEEVLRVTAAD